MTPLRSGPPFVVELAVALAFLLILAFSSPRIRLALEEIFPNVFHASALHACLPPTEYETVHIIVSLRDGELVTECMYIGARGAYRAGR